MTRRDRLMIIAVLSVALLGGFWMLVLSPQKKATADAQASLDSAKQALSTAQQKLSSGRAAQQAFRRDRTTIVKLGRVVPESDDIPTLLTQLETLADKEGVWFTSYSADSSGGGASAAAAATTSSSSAASSSTTVPQTGSTGAAADTNASTNAVAPLYPPGSVQLTGGLGRTPIKIKLKGGYFNLERYLRAVQRFAVLSAKESETKGRLIIVDGFSYKGSDRIVYVVGSGKKVKAAAKQNFLEAELSASVYFAPPLEAPAAVGGASTGTVSPTTSTTSTATGTAAIGGLR